jgi:acyl-CoA thioesterase
MDTDADTDKTSEERFLKTFEEKVKTSGWYTLIGMNPIIGDNVRVEIDIEDGHKQAFGTAHGGVIASILDSAAGLVVNKELLKRSKIAVTAEIKVNYLKPVTDGKLVAEGKIVSIGSRIAVSTAEARQDGDLVAIATATFYIMDAPPELTRLVRI